MQQSLGEKLLLSKQKTKLPFPFPFPPPQEIQLDVNPQALSFRSSLPFLSYNNAIPEDLSEGWRSLTTEKCPVLAVFVQ